MPKPLKIKLVNTKGKVLHAGYTFQQPGGTERITQLQKVNNLLLSQ